MAERTGPGAGLSCLVVDDEPRLRQVLVRLMVGEGFRCDEAPNGAEALEKLEAGDYVLVLSDLRMPRMDGLELLKNIQEKHSNVAVILITAVAEVEVALRSEEHTSELQSRLHLVCRLLLE